MSGKGAPDNAAHKKSYTKYAGEADNEKGGTRAKRARRGPGRSGTCVKKPKLAADSELSVEFIQRNPKRQRLFSERAL